MVKPFNPPDLSLSSHWSVLSQVTRYCAVIGSSALSELIISLPPSPLYSQTEDLQILIGGIFISLLVLQTLESLNLRLYHFLCCDGQNISPSVMKERRETRETKFPQFQKLGLMTENSQYFSPSASQCNCTLYHKYYQKLKSPNTSDNKWVKSSQCE